MRLSLKKSFLGGIFLTPTGSNPGGWDIFDKEGTSKKGCIEIEDWVFYVHFVLWFQENSISLYTYVLAKILNTKWSKIYTKTDSWFQKSHEEFGQLHTSGKPKTYLKLLSTTCVKIHQIMYICHFWNDKSFFTT